VNNSKKAGQDLGNQLGRLTAAPQIFTHLWADYAGKLKQKRSYRTNFSQMHIKMPNPGTPGITTDFSGQINVAP